jgi:competence protein ComEC
MKQGRSSWPYLLTFAVGCVLGATTPALPGMGWVAVLLLLAIVGLGHIRTRLPAVLLLGLVWFLGHAQWHMDRQWPDELAGEDFVLTGTVVGLPELREQGLRFEFQPDRGQIDGLTASTMLVNWYRPSGHVEPGSRWQLELQVLPPAGRDNPAGFDFQRYLLSRRIGATARVRGDSRLVAPAPTVQVDRLRKRMAGILQAETTRHDAAALKLALGLADRSAMAPELSDLLRRTGTAHLLAISGLHVGMVAGIAGLILAVVLAPAVVVHKRLDRRRLALAGGLLAATAYAMLAGFTLPTQRALIMLAAVALAFFFRRAIAPAHALLLALVAVLLFDPLAPLATGFWLSFAAVAVLVWAFAWRPADGASRAQWLTGLLRAQLIIAIGLLPLNVGIFQQFIPAALVANLVAIPMVGFWILPALLVEMAGVIWGVPAALFGALAESGLVRLVAFLEWLDGFEASHAAAAGASRVVIVSAMLGALWLIAPRGWPARWMGLPLLLPLLAPRVDALADGELQVWLLDAGDGLAVLVQTHDEILLYDTGPGDGQGGDMIGRELDGLLARLDRADIDRLVISHGHRGHAGGLGSVRHRLPDVRILSSIEGIGRPCLAGDQWNSGGYRFRMLHPSSGLPDLGPNSSCVLHIDGPGGSILFLGGIDSSVEARLLQQFAGPASDVLVLSAGGHRRAASPEFLEGVAPVLALASVRRHDRFGRPHPEVRSNVGLVGARLVSTGHCGAVRLRLREGAEPEIRSMATLKPRFWKLRTGCP